VVARVEGPDAEPEPLPPLEWLIGLGAAGSLLAAALVGIGSQVVTLTPPIARQWSSERWRSRCWYPR
jgi:hypothetical protein